MAEIQCSIRNAARLAKRKRQSFSFVYLSTEKPCSCTDSAISAVCLERERSLARLKSLLPKNSNGPSDRNKWFMYWGLAEWFIWFGPTNTRIDLGVDKISDAATLFERITGLKWYQT